MKYQSNIPSSNYWEVEIDLVEDLKELTYGILTRYGYENIDLTNSVVQYFDIINKCVKAIPRKVRYSNQFNCPKGYENDLKRFEELVISGKDLSPHMTKSLFKADKKDELLYDWGIKHFHLSSQYDDNGMAKRSDYLVFAIVTDDTFYFIQTYRHKEEYVFSNREMISIVNSNWPELLDPFRLKNASLTQFVSDKEYDMLRKAHINSFVEIGHEIIASVGGGYALSGVSFKAARQSDYWINMCSNLQLSIVQNASIIINTINECTNNKYHDMIFKLIAIDGTNTFTIVEFNSKTIMQINCKTGQVICYKPLDFLDYIPKIQF